MVKVENYEDEPDNVSEIGEAEEASEARIGVSLCMMRLMAIRRVRVR